MREPNEPVRRISRVDDAERHLDDELRFHFDTLCQELERDGWPAAEAAVEAKRRFGDEARYRRQLLREDRRGEARRRRRAWTGAVAEGVRDGARRMRRSPGLSLGIIAAFALGLGANVVMAGVLDRLLLRAPPHIREPASVRLLAVETYAAFRGERFASSLRSYPELTDFAAARTLEAVAGQNFSVREATVGRGAQAWRLKLLPVTGGWFGLLGVRMAAGRPLLPSDDVVGAAPVIVIGEGLARARFAGAARALGQTVDLGDGPRAIVGVAPRGFTGVKLERVDAWVPLAPWRTGIAGTTWMQNRRAYWVEIVARVAPGASIGVAESELTARLRSVRAAEIEAGRFDAAGRVLLTSLVPGESPLAPSEVRVARWLGAVSLVVLLVACIDIANLLLAREARGRRDLGIRLALGASRGRLATNVVVEVLMLALAGAAAALVLASALATAFARLLVPDGLPADALPTPRLLAFTVAIAAAAALVVALLPAVQSLRRDVLHALRASAGGISRSTARLRAGLVIAQVMLSAVLLVGAGLFVRSFAAARSSDLGVDLADTWYATLVLDRAADEADDGTLYERAVDALGGVPGISAAAASSTYPFFQQHGARLRVEGWDSVPGRVLVHAVLGDYFAALGLDIVRGRPLDARDRTGATLAAVVNRGMADRLWPEGALGRCLHIGADPAPCTQVVGVVEDVRVSGIGTEPPMQYYVSAAQQTPADAVFALLFRVDGAAPAQIAGAVQRALAAADARVRAADVQPVASILDSQMRPWRLGATLFVAFGALALLVAVLGLYGVIAFDVTQRLREIGLRAALGASPGRLLALVVRRALGLAAAGLVAGVVAALLLAPRLEALLFGVDARDPVTFVVITAVLLGAAVLAAVAPGARAARTDPNAALRVEV